jgi:small subunit ribosomal protein S21
VSGIFPARTALGASASFHHAVNGVSIRQNSNRKANPLQVLVRDNNVDQALRVLKKKMQREGVFREMKQRRFYEKPSERTTREKAEAVRRARKLARKKAQREGLIAAPKPKRVNDKMAGRPRFPGEVAPPRGT